MRLGPGGESFLVARAMNPGSTTRELSDTNFESKPFV